jgi:hypothetical protein
MEEENKIMMVNNIKEWLRIDSDISKITNELKEYCEVTFSGNKSFSKINFFS